MDFRQLTQGFSLSLYRSTISATELKRRSAAPILKAVQDLQSSTGSKKVLIVGHSLGAAIALLDSVYLPLHLPASTVFTTSVFGLPRVGNPAFANYGERSGRSLQ